MDKEKEKDFVQNEMKIKLLCDTNVIQITYEVECLRRITYAPMNFHSMFKPVLREMNAHSSGFSMA